MKTFNTTIALLIFLVVALQALAQEAEQDITPPVLHSIAFHPDPVIGGVTMTVTVHVTDNLSGVESIQIDVVNPDGEQEHTVSGFIETWEDLGGDQYSMDAVLDEHVMGGIWSVTFILIHDRAGNELLLDEGLSHTFSVVSDSPDTTPPEVSSVVLTPDPITPGDSLTIAITATDDISGIASIQVDIVNPDGEQEHSTHGLETDEWEVDGDVYSYKLHISEWAIDGLWRVSSLLVYDHAQNVLHLEDSVATIATFNVTSTADDTTPPTFHSIEIEPAVVIQGDSINIKIELTDDMSGIGSIQVDLVNRLGLDEHTTTGLPVEEWQFDGRFYSRKLQISEWAVPGEWIAASILVADMAGNELFMETEDRALPITSFHVELRELDTTPPALNSLAIEPDEIWLVPFGTDEGVDVIIGIVDIESGVDSIRVRVVNHEGGQEHETGMLPLEDWEIVESNVYSRFIQMHHTAMAGQWYVSEVSAYDKAGNLKVLDQTDTTVASATFTVTAGSKTVPPELLSLAIDPDEITPGGTLTITVKAIGHDAVPESIRVDVVNADGRQEHSTGDRQVDEWTNAGNDTYKSVLAISDWVTTGLWHVSSVIIYDALGNLLHLDHTDPLIASVTFSVVPPPPDPILPGLEEIAVEPSQIMQGDTIYISLIAIPGNAVIAEMQASVVNPDGEQQHSTGLLPIEEWDDLENDYYGSSLIITANAMPGRWYVSEVMIVDGDGHALHLTHPEPLLAGATFDVVPQPDKVADIDGNLYHIITIGEQSWLKQNLRVTKFSNGNEIATGLNNTDWSNTTSGAYAIYPHASVSGIDSEQEMAEAYGLLYNWFAVDDARGLCPDGWKPASYDDWQALLDHLSGGGYPNEQHDPNGAANALKSCRQVNSLLGGDCDTSLHPLWDADATHPGLDVFGYAALPAGVRNQAGSYMYIGRYSTWWTSTEHASDPTKAMRLNMSNYRGNVAGLGREKEQGFAVRCIKEPEELVNRPPLLPFDPTPENGAAGQAIDVTLSWDCSDPDEDPLTFDVYFGTEPDPPIVAEGISDFSYDPGALELNTTYYWKITAHDDQGNSTEGHTWDFATQQPNQPPLPPHYPVPGVGATDQESDVTLSWSCSDPDEDPLTFDVYFGTEPDPPIVAEGISDFSYDPGAVELNTTYYWKITAHDDQGHSTEGEVWDFATQQLQVGDGFGGGIVAYIFEPGDPGYVEGEVHGLIAAPEDLGEAEWGCYGTTIGGTGTGIGAGAANTAAILAGCSEAGIAAKICNDLVLYGFDDWFLPSKDELNILYLNKDIIGGFESEYYWSSSEVSHEYSRVQHLNNGHQAFINKNYTCRLRAVRVF